MGLSDVISRFNWVDVLILILLFKICYVGFTRGLGSELLPLLGICGVLVITFHFYSQFGSVIANHSPLSGSAANFTTYIALAFITKYIFHLIDILVIKKIVNVQILSIYDRIGGVIAGAIRAILLISVLVTALELAPFSYIRYSVKTKSITASFFIRTGAAVHKKIAAFLKI